MATLLPSSSVCCDRIPSDTENTTRIKLKIENESEMEVFVLLYGFTSWTLTTSKENEKKTIWKLHMNITCCSERSNLQNNGCTDTFLPSVK